MNQINNDDDRVLAYSLAKEIDHQALDEIAGGANSAATNCEYTFNVASVQGQPATQADYRCRW